MTFLQRPFQIEKKALPSNIFYAPLAGCSDFPFRRISSRFKPGLQFCEMVKMEPLVRLDKNTFQMVDFDETMRPIGAQLCGSNPVLAGEAAKILEELGVDWIDLNCGCPVDKVTKDGSGSGLLRDPWRIGEIIYRMVKAVNIPVSVKIRAGWDENSIVVSEVTKIAEMAGAQAITIHGRTRKQAYEGPANWSWVKEAKESAKKIKVIGNGDLFSPEAVKKMVEETGVDGVLIARGTLGNPWICDDIYQFFKTGVPPLRSNEEKRAIFQAHFEEIFQYQNNKKCFVDMRRIGSWYGKSLGYPKSFRAKISHVSSFEEIALLLRETNWEESALSEEPCCD